MAPAIQVAVLDSGGALVRTPDMAITLSLGVNPTGATLAGTLTVTSTNGIATFENLRVDRAGQGFTLLASAPDLTSATSSPFSILLRNGIALAFRNQPASVVAGVLITPPIEVALVDDRNHVVTAGTVVVTLSLADQATGTLVGTTSLPTSGGIARFSDLSIAKAGEQFTLVASAAGTPSARSGVFTVSPPVGFHGSAIATADRSTCALDAAGAAWCWGDNTVGQLGNGRLVSSTAPVRVSGGLRFNTMSLAKATGTGEEGHHGGDHDGSGIMTCGLTDMGGAYCWGGGPYPANGVDAATPGPVAGALTFADLTTAAGMACGLTAEGSVWCWPPAAPSPTGGVPARVDGGIHFTAVQTSRARTCGLDGAGAAYCWGSGRLGDGTIKESASPVAVHGDLTFSAITVGVYHTCALTTAGDAWCWGSSYQGEVGDGSDAHEMLTPVRVSGGLRFVSIDAGASRTCALTAEGQAWCWGANWKGQLGDGTTTDRNVPVPVATQIRFATISAGWAHTCALTTDGEAWCWGWSNDGQLGDGHWRDARTPVRVVTDLRFREIAAGGDATCGITIDGRGWCWGDNYAGELGDGKPLYSAIPVRVTGGFKFTELAGGWDAMCGVTAAGETRCWGRISDSLGNRSEPVTLSGDPRFKALSVNGGGCGVTQDGGGWCWGWNAFAPSKMFGGLSLTDVFAGTHACGLTTDGDTYCLGSPISGGVGGTPTLLGGGLKFVAIAGGTDHDCGVTAGGEAYCWGQNYSGQLGAGSRTPQEPTPLPVQGGLRFSTISVGNLITCGVTLQHEGYCWTGDSNNRGYSMPTLVPGGLSFTTIEVSHGNGGHVCGATTAGALYCWGNSDWWGNNLRGQLGTGAAARETYRTPPMPVVGGLVVGQQARR